MISVFLGPGQNIRRPTVRRFEHLPSLKNHTNNCPKVQDTKESRRKRHKPSPKLENRFSKNIGNDIKKK